MPSCYQVRIQIFADSPEDAINKTIRNDTRAIEAEVQDLGHQIQYPPKFKLPMADWPVIPDDALRID